MQVEYYMIACSVVDTDLHQGKDIYPHQLRPDRMNLVRKNYMTRWEGCTRQGVSDIQGYSPRIGERNPPACIPIGIATADGDLAEMPFLQPVTNLWYQITANQGGQPIHCSTTWFKRLRVGQDQL